MSNEKMIHGVIERVPCPHCGAHNDFRQLESQTLLDTGSTMECDHCHLLMQVVAVRKVTLVAVRAMRGRPAARLPDAAPARTLSPAALSKLLKR